MNYARFITFRDEPVILTNANNECYSEQGTKYFQIECDFEEFNGLNIFPLGRVQEIELWDLIKQRTKSRLDDYKHTFDQDMHLLKQEGLNTTLRNIITLRSKEKSILHLCLSVCDWTIDFLNKTKSEAKELMDERNIEGSMS